LRRILPLLVLVACAGCAGQHKSAAYRDGYDDGNEALQAEPLVTGYGSPAAASRFRKACVEVANFYVVPDDERTDWIPGCIDGAHALLK
jgi:hypothetical protein